MPRDQKLDLLRRHAFGLGLHRNDGLGQVRKHIHWNPRQHHEAVADQKGGAEKDDQPMFEARRDQKIEHGVITGSD